MPDYDLQLTRFWEEKLTKKKEKKRAYGREYMRRKAEEVKEPENVLSESDKKKMFQERRDLEDSQREATKARKARLLLPLFLVEMSGNTERIHAHDSTEARQIFCDNHSFNFWKIGYLVIAREIKKDL